MVTTTPYNPVADPDARPRVLVMANQKGEVGKTTTAINLGTALAAIGERVLIIDLDPQGDAAPGLGIDRKSRVTSSYDALVGERALRDVITPTAVPRLSIAPSTMDLLGVELEISGDSDRSYKLRKALQTFFDGDRDRPEPITYVLVDCPPSLNLLTINALAAADAVVVPLQCEFFALEGLSQLLTTVDQVRRTLNPALTIHGVVLTMFDPRNSLAGRWSPTSVRTWATRSTTPSFLAMSGCPRPRFTASRRCFTICGAPEAKLISSSPRKSFNAKAARRPH